ncbi:helix-turn-helix domain-containing protein [Paenibacillus sp. JJ-223]|uniref:helix-turn-helix domain-containing protein n=1 Tax=Paenibacillus sp. JJ-223 TaxID=2905647 RepID=UPI001F462C61|nr:helix-turn-helix domain-containing protein [Paenibacillus sp. JJ-223]CAH1199231.1 Arabinose operon regulatory protein [Paenibacillus sp. JJ-223]
MAENPNNPAMAKNDEQYTHPPGILVSDYYRMPYGYTCYRPNGTKDWLIMYTLSGKGVVNHEDHGFLECAEGTVTIIPPGVKHHFYTEQHEVWEKMWAHYTPRMAWSDWLPASQTDGAIYHLQIDSTQTRASIEHAFRRILSYRVEPVIALQEELMLNALEEIILILASQHADRKLLDPRVKEVLNILALHFAENHLIEDLANQVFLSPSRLSHLFKEQVGDSIVATLNKYRLKQAEKLLRYTQRPITEIALSVGFHSPDYFTRMFTQYYGVKPSQYRKQRAASL